MSIEVNQAAPPVDLPADDGSQWTLVDARGRRVLLVFYPGDDTPVCTAQLCDYRDGIESFSGLDVEVVGISTDDAASHRAFKTKHALPFKLLTDRGGAVAKQYGAWGMMGMKRAVFLIDEAGLVQYAKVESVALFRRSRDQLIEVIQRLPANAR